MDTDKIAADLREGQDGRTPGMGNTLDLCGWRLQYTYGPRLPEREMHQFSAQRISSVGGKEEWQTLGAVQASLGMPPLENPSAFFQFTDITLTGPMDRMTWRWFSKSV